MEKKKGKGEQVIKKGYIYFVPYLKSKFRISNNAIIVDYSNLDIIERKKFFLYLEKKNYEFYEVDERGKPTNKVIIMIRNSKERKNLYGILRYYGLAKQTRTDIIISFEEIPELKNFKTFSVVIPKK